jgi:hypothetical protein
MHPPVARRQMDESICLNQKRGLIHRVTTAGPGVNRNPDLSMRHIHCIQVLSMSRKGSLLSEPQHSLVSEAERCSIVLHYIGCLIIIPQRWSIEITHIECIYTLRLPDGFPGPITVHHLLPIAPNHSSRRIPSVHPVGVCPNHFFRSLMKD